MEPPAKKQCLGKETDKQDEEGEEQTGWFNLPFELRSIIMEQMDNGAIPKFARCSKLCYEEATSSNNYCDDIGLYEMRGNPKRFEIQFTSRSWQIGSISLEYFADGTTKVQCEKFSYFRMILGQTSTVFFEPGNVYDVVADYLNKYLQLFRANLKCLIIRVLGKAKNVLTRKVCISGFKKLQLLRFGETSNQLCLFKYNFVDFEQVLNVKSFIELPGTRFTFDQLIQFKANQFTISQMDLTKKEINQFIKYWRDGKLYPNLESFTISNDKTKKKSTMEIDFEGIDHEPYKSPYGDEYLKVKSSSEQNKYALLELKDNSLHVRIENDKS